MAPQRNIILYAGVVPPIINPFVMVSTSQSILKTYKVFFGIKPEVYFLG
jgi:hypothetical protein